MTTFTELEEKRRPKWFVSIDCPPYPFKGCVIDVIRFRKDETFDDIRDYLSPDMLEGVIIRADEARDVEEARAVGLRKIIDKITEGVK